MCVSVFLNLFTMYVHLFMSTVKYLFVLYWSGCCLVEAGGRDRVVLHEYQPP